MFDWFRAIQPAYLETLKWQVDVSENAAVAGGILRTGVQGAKSITEVVYPVRWFLAQQVLVRELLKVQPGWLATGEERLTWALFLMAAVGEGMLAINASDLLWGRAFYGVPPWVAKALNPKWQDWMVRPIPSDYMSSLSMRRLYEGYAKVVAARAKLNLKVPVGWGVPFGEGPPKAQTWAFPCPVADVSRMKAAGYWQTAWDKVRPFTRESSVGPLVMGCGTMNRAPFLTLPLMVDVYDRPRWWMYGGMRLQPMHIPWSRGSTFKSLYNQSLGITARGWNRYAAGREMGSKFMVDVVATEWRDQQYLGATSGAAKEVADFNRVMASKWSFLAFRYQADAIGDSTVLPSPFDQHMSGSYSVPRGFRFIPTLPELVRDTSKSVAFNVALLSGEYSLWGTWFQAIDYPELVSTFQKDWSAFYANGQKPSDVDFTQAYLGHDDMQKIRAADNKASWLGVLGPVLSEIGAIVDAYYGNYASAIGNMKSAIQGAKKHLDSAGNIKASDVFVEMPDDVFLRSGGIPADPDADPLKQPRDMVFLSDTHGNTATVLGRYAVAFSNSIALIRSAMPGLVWADLAKYVKPISLPPGATRLTVPPPTTVRVQDKTLRVSSRSSVVMRVGVWTLAGAATAGGVWLLRKRRFR